MRRTPAGLAGYVLAPRPAASPQRASEQSLALAARRGRGVSKPARRARSNGGAAAQTPWDPAATREATMARAVKQAASQQPLPAMQAAENSPCAGRAAGCLKKSEMHAAMKLGKARPPLSTQPRLSQREAAKRAKGGVSRVPVTSRKMGSRAGIQRTVEALARNGRQSSQPPLPDRKQGGSCRRQGPHKSDGAPIEAHAACAPVPVAPVSRLRKRRAASPPEAPQQAVAEVWPGLQCDAAAVAPAPPPRLRLWLRSCKRARLEPAPLPDTPAQCAHIAPSDVANQPPRIRLTLKPVPAAALHATPVKQKRQPLPAVLEGNPCAAALCPDTPAVQETDAGGCLRQRSVGAPRELRALGCAGACRSDALAALVEEPGAHAAGANELKSADAKEFLADGTAAPEGAGCNSVSSAAPQSLCVEADSMPPDVDSPAGSRTPADVEANTVQPGGASEGGRAGLSAFAEGHALGAEAAKAALAAARAARSAEAACKRAHSARGLLSDAGAQATGPVDQGGAAGDATVASAEVADGDAGLAKADVALAMDCAAGGSLVSVRGAANLEQEPTGRNPCFTAE